MLQVKFRIAKMLNQTLIYLFFLIYFLIILIVEGTVMHIEKALINDRLRVSKVS